MDQLQLYINDELVDLNDDSPIALSFQINNLADVKNQQGNTSNQFKLPLTQRNRQILGFPDDVAFATKLPYQKYTAKVIQDGLEIIPYGVAELNSIEQNNANMTILSGNVDFFDAIDGKVYDMGDKSTQWGKNLPWKPYEHKWDIINVAHSQSKTEGWIWPIVDYGIIGEHDDGAIIDIHNQRPGFFIKTAVDLLLKSTGYKGTGSLFSDPLYPLLICQFSNSTFDHGSDSQNSADFKNMTAETGMDQFYGHPYRNVNENGHIPFNVIFDPSNASHYQNDAYFADDITSVNVSFNYSLVFKSDDNSRGNNASKMVLQIRLNDSHIVGFDELVTEKVFEYAARGDSNAIYAYNETISADIILQPGQILTVTYQFRDKPGSYFTLKKGAKFLVKNKVADMQPGQMMQCERIFPDISQKDLLKDTLQRFGIICQTDNTNKTIYFNSFRDIVNNIPIAKNWSNKCVDQGKQISFQLGNYAQINYMQYKTDDNVLPLKYGWSQMNIDDKTLAANGTLFESVFGPTLNRSFYGGNIAQIKMIDENAGDNDFSINVDPRILIDQKTNISGKTITFTDGLKNIVVNDVISTPYFYKADAPSLSATYGKGSLLFDDLRKKYYSELEQILTETKKVVRYFLLSPRDILDIDLFIPIYLDQDSAYYYINKIDSWRKGHPCKVELVKLG